MFGSNKYTVTRVEKPEKRYNYYRITFRNEEISIFDVNVVNAILFPHEGTSNKLHTLIFKIKGKQISKDIFTNSINLNSLLHARLIDCKYGPDVGDIPTDIYNHLGLQDTNSNFVAMKITSFSIFAENEEEVNETYLAIGNRSTDPQVVEIWADNKLLHQRSI